MNNDGSSEAKTAPERDAARRIAVVGAGRMGLDHIRRLQTQIRGARVVAVVDVCVDRARAVVGESDIAFFEDLGTMLATVAVDGVIIATPGCCHEDNILAVLEANIPMLCEKPLTPDARSARRIVQEENRRGRRLIQVGFMRRFDPGYLDLKLNIERARHEGKDGLGHLLMVHCAHRNPLSPPGFLESMLMSDSVVHEFDVLRYLTGEEIATVQVRRGRLSSRSPQELRDPQQVLIRTSSNILADVEIVMNSGYGYEVSTEAIFEQGIRRVGHGEVTEGFVERFAEAYRRELQDWVDALTKQGAQLVGPDAWDGYAAAECCEAAIRAQSVETEIEVQLHERPLLYDTARRTS